MSYKLLKRMLCSTTITKLPRQVCIVGAGPAGFYAAMHLTKNLDSVNIDIIEKLPVPFGLIRYLDTYFRLLLYKKYIKIDNWQFISISHTRLTI